MRAPLFPVRTTALAVIALVGVAVGALDARDRSDDDQIWLLPYESGRN